jgi:molecular chaperone GrpE
VTDASNRRGDKSTQPPLREREPLEGTRGNREVPPSDPARQQLDEVGGGVEALRGKPEVPPPRAGTAADGRLAAAEAKAQEHLDDLKRLAAEFENYKKRAAREQQSLSARAAERLVKELLPIVDDLERALVAAEEHEEAKLEDGVRLVHRQLASVLEREGLAEIETDGKFDPHVHEALLSQPSEADEGTVIEVLQKGYTLGDRVLRPARVVIAAPVNQKESDAGGDDT